MEKSCVRPALEPRAPGRRRDTRAATSSRSTECASWCCPSVPSMVAAAAPARTTLPTTLPSAPMLLSGTVVADLGNRQRC